MGPPLLFIIRASSSTSLPQLFEGDTLTGRVVLDLEKAENVKAIVVAVLAGTTAVGQEEARFLDIEKQLWPTPTLDTTKRTGSNKIAKGHQSWPFTIALPKTVPVTESNGKSGVYPLPPSFSERASPVYIDYRVRVTVKRGILRVDQPLTINFGYSPMMHPGPPSALRSLAYSDGTLLVGPEGDPEGWKVCPSVKVKGTLFTVRTVEVECVLAIATPLCYAIGTTVPVEITIKGEDKQAMDLLATPEALRLHLVRALTTGSDAMDDDGERRSNNHFLESVGEGYFWQLSDAESGVRNQGERILRGEIEVQKKLRPNFKFPKVAMRVKYMLHLLPFQAPGFIPEGEKGEALISVPVSIVMRQTPGVRMRSYAPPGYEKPQGGDYNKSMGFMENGNQRFYNYHHGS
ncbi:hypothetical protein ONZ45_g13244 [Pleurotus djamor]|nr:hypothetical protein ONZ45_g13244 [Pleurotus djamor]